jgi:ubiquinol oxidase
MTMLLDNSSRTAQPLTTETHGEPPKLTPEELARTHAETLAAPKRKYSLASRFLFLQMDLLYGRRRTLEKFMVLEIVARVPYQTWESASYKQITRKHRKVGLALRIFDRLREFRAQQDNEQWHLLILEELTADEPRRSWFKHRVVPQMLAFAYYQLSWMMFVIRPAWSYRLNADFEDHAEHEYALLVQEHPEWETTPYEGTFVDDFGRYDSLADLFRQIGYDERLHKLESEINMVAPRFE